MGFLDRFFGSKSKKEQEFPYGLEDDEDEAEDEAEAKATIEPAPVRASKEVHFPSDSELESHITISARLGSTGSSLGPSLRSASHDQEDFELMGSPAEPVNPNAPAIEQLLTGKRLGDTFLKAYFECLQTPEKGGDPAKCAHMSYSLAYTHVPTEAANNREIQKALADFKGDHSKTLFLIPMVLEAQWPQEAHIVLIAIERISGAGANNFILRAYDPKGSRFGDSSRKVASAAGSLSCKEAIQEIQTALRSDSDSELYLHYSEAHHQPWTNRTDCGVYVAHAIEVLLTHEDSDWEALCEMKSHEIAIEKERLRLAELLGASDLEVLKAEYEKHRLKKISGPLWITALTLGSAAALLVTAAFALDLLAVDGPAFFDFFLGLVEHHLLGVVASGVIALTLLGAGIAAFRWESARRHPDQELRAIAACINKDKDKEVNINPGLDFKPVLKSLHYAYRENPKDSVLKKVEELINAELGSSAGADNTKRTKEPPVWSRLGPF